MKGLEDEGEKNRVQQKMSKNIHTGFVKRIVILPHGDL